MNNVWNLDPIYLGFDDPAFDRDLKELKEAVAEFAAWTKELADCEPFAGLKEGIARQEKLMTLGGKLNIGKITLSGKKLVIADEGLTVTQPIELTASAGVFATNVKTDLSSCFKIPDGFTMVYNAADQTLELKSELHKKHCACNGADLGLASHTCTPIDDWQPLTTDLFTDAKTSAGSVTGYKLKEEANYFLNSDLHLTKGLYNQLGHDVTICLNGHSISRQTGKVFPYLKKGATLNICDCSGVQAADGSWNDTIPFIPSGSSGLVTADGLAFLCRRGDV